MSAFLVGEQPPIRNLHPALALTLDDDLAVPRAQFDLPHVAASAVDLLGNGRCGLSTRPRSALRDVLNRVESDGDRLGIEVGLKHRTPS